MKRKWLVSMVLGLIFLFSLLLVFRTGTVGLINLGDSVFPFFPQQSFQRLLYLWDPHNLLGLDISISTPQLPWYGLAALLDRVGVPLWAVNRLWFVLPFLLLGLSMYFLSGVIFGKDKKFSRLIATLFFLFNPFTINLVSGSNILTFSFAAGVFVFGLFVRGLGKANVNLRDIVLIGATSIFATANLPVLAMAVLLCAAYFLFFVLVNRSNWQKLVSSLKFVLCAVCCVLLANAWWLIPFIYQLRNPGYFGTLFAAGTDVGTLKFMAEHTSLFNVSRLFYGIVPSFFYPISSYYHYLLAPTMMSVTLLISYAVAIFLKRNESSKFEIFFLVLAWVSVILASGTRPPFGFVYQFLWDHIPYFNIFRTTNRFNLYTMISYAILLGFFYQRIKSLALNRKSEALTFGFILISVLLSAWPLLSGNIYGQLQPHQIPDDYYQLREFLNDQEGDFRVMSLPMISWLAAYSWSAPFDMQEILIDFSPKDMVVNMPGHYPNLLERELTQSEPLYSLAYYYLSQRPGKLAAMFFEEGEPTTEDVLFYKEFAEEQTLDALRLMGVKYLVVHRDYVIIYHGFPRVDISILERNIKDNEGLVYLKSFGDLDIYEVEDIRPRIYTTSGKAEFQRINPAEYKITVTGAEGLHKLVFSENFNRGWRLDEFGVGTDLERGFGNVWRIDKSGDYQLKLYYWPQRLLEIGLAVSVLSLVGGFALLIKKR